VRASVEVRTHCVEEPEKGVVEGPQTRFWRARAGSVWVQMHLPVLGRVEEPAGAQLPSVTQPDRAREWVIGGRRGIVCNRCAVPIVRVLDRVSAGPAHGRVGRAFGGREVVWRALEGREREGPPYA
jgi:hypothetical protein